MRHHEWHAGPDDDLARALRDELAGPDPDGYVTRLRGFLALLPERDTEWDVLAGWARPRVLAAAMAAAFLLGVALFTRWPGPAETPEVEIASMPAAAILAPTAGGPAPVTFAVLEGR